MSKTATYALIASNTLGSATQTVTFTSIPSTYTDLVLIGTGTSSTWQNVRFRFNSDSGSNYSNTVVYGDGSGAVSARNISSTALIFATLSNTVQSNFITHIMDYSNTTTNKTVIQRGNDTSLLARADVGLWRNTNTSAISSIELFTISGNLNTGSTFKLYGIQEGNA
jgi:hypothetical protein